MPRIWRVEDSEGLGVYKACSRNDELDAILEEHEHNNIDYPVPLDDIGIHRSQQDNEICGFKDKKQAMRWFNEMELNCAEQAGFTLKKIEVKEITEIGDKQVLAIR